MLLGRGSSSSCRHSMPKTRWKRPFGRFRRASPTRSCWSTTPAPTRPSRWPRSWACGSSCTTATAATAATRRPVTARRCGRGRHRRHAASRLPVHAAAGRRHGRHDRLRRVRRRAGLAHPRRHGALRAACRVYKYVVEPLPDRVPEPDARARSCPSTTPATGRSRARCSRRCRSLANSDDFVFDNQMLAQAVAFGFSIGEISCPTQVPSRSELDQLQPFRQVWPRRRRNQPRIRRLAVGARVPARYSHSPALTVVASSGRPSPGSTNLDEQRPRGLDGHGPR